MLAREVGSFLRGAYNASLLMAGDRVMRESIEKLNQVSDAIIENHADLDELAAAVDEIAAAQ